MSDDLNWFRRYGLLFFFILTYSISWGLFLFYIFVPSDLSLLLIIFGIYSPAISALIVSKLTGEKESKNKSKFRWIIFILIWIFGSSIFIINYVVQMTNISMCILIGAIILGILPAITFLAGFSSNPEIKGVFHTYIKPKGHYIYYLFAILYLPGIFLIGIGVNLLLGQPVDWIDLPEGANLIFLIFVTFFYTFFFGAGTNEEPGWRGFALPKLQTKFSPIIASLILGVIWALWHAPIYLPQYGSILAFSLFVFNTIKITVLLTWLYNRTGGSVLACALLHTTGNITFEFLPSTLASSLIDIAITVMVIFFDRMWKRLNNEPDGIRKMNGL